MREERERGRRETREGVVEKFCPLFPHPLSQSKNGEPPLLLLIPFFLVVLRVPRRSYNQTLKGQYTPSSELQGYDFLHDFVADVRYTLGLRCALLDGSVKGDWEEREQVIEVREIQRDREIFVP